MKSPIFSDKFSQTLVLAVLTATILAGCSGSRGVTISDRDLPDGFPNHSYEQLISQLEERPYDLTSYTSESALAIKSPVQSGSFSASITHRKNDSLLISISPGLGIVAAKALVTSDSFYVHDRINKELGIGTIGDMQRLLPLPADTESLYDAMLGTWLPETTSDWELTAEKSYYILKEPNGERTLFIDPTQWRVVRYVQNDADGKLIEERTFAEFDDFDGFLLPRRLTFRRPGDETSASLFHRKLTINPAALSFDFDVNKSVKRFNF